MRLLNKKKKLFIIILIEVLLLFNLGIYLKIQEPQKKLINLEVYYPNITSSQIISECGNYSEDLYKIYCLNRVYTYNVEYDNCSDRRYTLYPEQTINLKKGCCRESTSFYAYFLNKFGIEYVIVSHPQHIFLIAFVEKEGKLQEYVLLDGTEMQEGIMI